MKFKLQPKFTALDIDKQVTEIFKGINKVMLNELIMVGLEAVKSARLKVPFQEYHADAKDIVTATKLAGGSIDFNTAGGFNDQTGNLRSSIGFIILYNGEILHQDFEMSPRGTDKQAGLNAGKSYAKEQGMENQKGWAIITVAGMEYASWVEAKGYDVITGSNIAARGNLKKGLERLDKLKFT